MNSHPRSFHVERPAMQDCEHWAARFAQWIGRSLLTIIILLVGISFGRQVQDWWTPAPPRHPPSAAQAEINRWCDPTLYGLVEFGGESWNLGRQQVTGSEQLLRNALRARCRQLASDPIIPVKPPTAEEARFLAMLAEREPVERQPGQWTLYEYGNSLPLVVATGPSADAVPATQEGAQAGRSVRVLAWAIGMPRDLNSWTIISASASAANVVEEPDLEDLPFPPGSERLLCLRGADDRILISFRGPADPEAWRSHFCRWLQLRGGKLLPTRHLDSEVWQLRGELGKGNGARTVELRFGPSVLGTRQCFGLMSCAPVIPGAARHEG
jgi:hypothetical protein